jgi:hypothetical protein
MFPSQMCMLTNKAFPWKVVLFGKLIVPQLFSHFPGFLEYKYARNSRPVVPVLIQMNTCYKFRYTELWIWLFRRRFSYIQSFDTTFRMRIHCALFFATLRSSFCKKWSDLYSFFAVFWKKIGSLLSTSPSSAALCSFMSFPELLNVIRYWVSKLMFPVEPHLGLPVPCCLIT